MNEISEALKGFSDIPIVFLTFILGIISLKRTKDKAYSRFFFLLAISSAIGTAIHIIKTSVLIKNIVWAVLYPLLFEAVRKFSVLFSEYISGENRREFHYIYFFEVLLALGAIIFLFLLDKYDMLFLIFFSLLCSAGIISAIIKAKRLPAKAAAAIILLPFVVLLQTFSKVIPYSVVYEHIIIFALILLVYFMFTDKEKKSS